VESHLEYLINNSKIIMLMHTRIEIDCLTCSECRSPTNYRRKYGRYEKLNGNVVGMASVLWVWRPFAQTLALVGLDACPNGPTLSFT
jgi:hypothetical protein